MGNTDSHSSFVPPAKSSRFPSRREEVPSARSWWKCSRGGGGYLNQHVAGPPFTSWHYEPKAGSPPRFLGFVEAGGGSAGPRGERTSAESGGSPKVLLGKDGSMRVEFTNAKGLPAASAAEPSLRTSKGSSLSSDGSWYDSPWGAGGGEPANNAFACGRSAAARRFTEETRAAGGGYNTVFSAPADRSPGSDSGLLFPAAGYNTCSSGRTEDSGIGDSVILQAELRDCGPASPSSSSSSLDGVCHNAPHAGPLAPALLLLDDVIREEEGSGGGAERRYSSVTLPCRRVEPAGAAGNDRKDFLKSRIRRLSDWTGSLSRKKRRIQEPNSSDTTSSLWASNPIHTLNLNHNQFPAAHWGSFRSLNLNQNLNLNLSQNLTQSSDLQRQNVYDSFMQELETHCSSTTERTELSEEEEEEEEQEEQEEEQEEEEVGGGEQLDVPLEEEQGAVRRAGWLSFKALISVSRDRKLQLLARRRWRRYWVTLRGVSLLCYESPGKGVAARLALLAAGGLVQAVPEHPKREHVFCLSNAHGDVHLLQASSQSDLEDWVTALHSASASLLARRSPHQEDALLLLRRRSRALLQRIATDGRMKKMAELQLSVIKEAKNRRAVEGQIQQWEQNLEQLNLDLFRLRCYLSSLQGGELPNPKSLLAVASRPSKSMLGRLGVFSVSSFHALVCSRDEAAMRRRRRPLSTGSRRKGAGLPSSLDVLKRRSRDVSPSPYQTVQRGHALYQTFPEGRAAESDIPRNPYGRDAILQPASHAHLQPASPAHLSACQRLRKVIQELVDTEKSYVKDLERLFELYLTPLQHETFLSKEEMEALFGSLPEMLDFQRGFLQTLEERIASCPDFTHLDSPEQLKHLLFSLGGSFLDYADHFKHYSGFCANHAKVQKVLERAKTDGAFKCFLETRNPTNQHSASLESYLIKPVQRVLKYPLLLRELVSLTDPESPEHTHLTEALRAMEKVATHINEMQKIYEDYGCVFDQLTAEHSSPDKQVTEVSMGDFLVHSSVVWLNPLPSLGRLRKDPQLSVFVFRRAVILVYRETSKLKKRMTASRSADPDPFRFRWLIPVSAVQVRPVNITGSRDPCVWELVHSRSEREGRPETVFQLCSSGVETKAGVLRALRGLVGERAPAGSVRRPRAPAERSGSWRRRQQRRTPPRRDEEEGSCSEPLLPGRNAAAAANDPAGKRTRLCSLTGELEAQLQRLNFSEEEKRSSSLRRSPGGEAPDPAGLLERDFSVHSLTSMISEDCFYDAAAGRRGPPSLHG
ncbi:rho guanine nucleotide exchange factor TIAM2-like [Clinocottus analis]|uniref:rho guanine nucleotide exchange factor TIAM2-like n=1 Tax=Clinocottus analis TaxID=304258 RepID=UPI0035C0071A